MGFRGGAYISDETALKIATVFACVRIIATTLGTLPIHLMHDLGESRERLPLPDIIKRPNKIQNKIAFIEYATACLALWGNCYYERIYDKETLNVKEYIPIPPNLMDVQIADDGGKKFIFDGKKEIPRYKVLHIQGLSISTPYKGEPVISLVRNGAANLAYQAETFGINFFTNGTNMGGVIEWDKDVNIDPEVRKQIVAKIIEQQQGLDSSHGLGDLPPGARYAKVGIPPEDAQFLETRRFQRTEIATWFGVPPHLVQDLQESTNNNIEHQGIEAVRYLFRPYAVRIEDALTEDLFTPKDNLFLQFNLDGLLRGDLKSRMDSYHIALQDGVYNADEVRALEDMNPQEGGIGKIYLAAANMIDKRKLSAMPVSAAKAEANKPTRERVIEIVARAAQEAGSAEAPDLSEFTEKYFSGLSHRSDTANQEEESRRFENAFRYQTWKALGRTGFRVTGECQCPDCVASRGVSLEIGSHIGTTKKYHPPFCPECAGGIEVING